MSTTEKPSSVHASKDAPATTSNIPASTVSQLTLRERLSRLKPYFGYQRWTWVLAVLATIVVAGTEVAIPALLQPLVDKGFTGGTMPL